MKYNSYSHYYLYAKGWYKKSDDIIDDLKKIYSKIYGIEEKYVEVGHIISLLAKLAYKHIKKEYQFFDFIDYLNPNSFANKLYKTEYEFNKNLINACLKIIAFTQIGEWEGYLEEADENILPLNKKG